MRSKRLLKTDGCKSKEADTHHRTRLDNETHNIRETAERSFASLLSRARQSSVSGAPGAASRQGKVRDISSAELVYDPVQDLLSTTSTG
jgi:hypothetical protein